MFLALSLARLTNVQCKLISRLGELSTAKVPCPALSGSLRFSTKTYGCVASHPLLFSLVSGTRLYFYIFYFHTHIHSSLFNFSPFSFPVETLLLLCYGIIGCSSPVLREGSLLHISHLGFSTCCYSSHTTFITVSMTHAKQPFFYRSTTTDLRLTTSHNDNRSTFSFHHVVEYGCYEGARLDISRGPSPRYWPSSTSSRGLQQNSIQ